MKTTLIVLFVALSTGCYAHAKQDGPTYAQLQEENRRLRAEYAKRQQQAPQGPATGAPQTTQVVQGSTGAMWARQRHGVYMGTVGAQPRQVTQGRKLKLDNQVCDGGSRNMWSKCWDADDNGSPDLNTWLAFEIDGQPVVCDSGFFHPESQVSLLPPGQTCHVEVGRSRTVHLTIKAYRNSGTASYVMLDSTPYASSLRTVSVGDRNIATFGIDETRF